MTDHDVNIKWIEKAILRIEKKQKEFELEIKNKADKKAVKSTRNVLYGVGLVVVVSVLNAILKLIGLTP